MHWRREIDQSQMKIAFDQSAESQEERQGRCVHLNSYLRASLATDAALVKEQSCPPNPLLQEHEAEQVTVGIVQLYLLFPEGSEYLQAPFPEHAVPERIKRIMRDDKNDKWCSKNAR